MPSFDPCEPLIEVLLPCLRPCAGFTGACGATARWDPGTGHVPRGFVGALGSADDVKLIVVTAEPGDPRPGERQDIDPGALRGSLGRVCEFTYQQLESRFSIYHANMRRLLDLCWPGLDLAQQMRRTWITESALCSAPRTTERAAHDVHCGMEFLAPQLALFPSVPVIALGGKAQGRVRRVAPGRDIIGAYAAAPPGGNHRGAYPSWKAAADLFATTGSGGAV